MKSWAEMHTWCQENYADRYAWIGDHFWFLDEDDAFLFRLTWSL